MDLYFISNGRDEFKIGKSKCAATRLETFQCASSSKLSIVRVFPTGGRLEGRVHQALADHRLSGEWFESCPALHRMLACDDVQALAALLGARSVTHSMGIVTDIDNADLDRAAEMVAEGKALRKRVLSRIRQCRYRKAKA